MSIKRQLVVAALLAVPLLGLFFWWGFRTPPFSIINGRTLVDWLREVEFEGFQHKVAANEVLYAAGPKIIPTLSRVLRQPDFPLMARLPSAWIPESMRARDSDQKKIRANAAWVISVIVHRNPDCPESLSAVPSLIAGLSSHSQQVRYVSAQGLAAIGASASNAVPALVLRVADDSSSVRFCAIEALGRIGFCSTGTLQIVRTALADTNGDVRIVATQALARLEVKTE